MKTENNLVDAPAQPTLERLLTQDRRMVIGALALVIVLAWAWLLAGAGMGMTAFEMTRHSGMDMPAGEPRAWHISWAVLMFFMWWIMMIAMMLPSATPVILLAARVNRNNKSGRRPYGSTAAFTLGYLLAWAGFSVVAVGLQWILEQSGLLNSMLVGTSNTFSGWILVIAGLWQFTPWKQSCLNHCRSPVEVLSQNSSTGNSGALRTGLKHGAWCLGCCWFLMALLFVGGVMNLYWIIGLAAYVFIEKVLPAGPVTARVTGLVLLAWGLFLLLS